jgi:hypothetical protein
LIAVSPAVRATITRLFSISGVEITRVPPGRTVPAAVGGRLDLGTRTTLASAQKHVRFQIVLPRYQTVAVPDEVYLGGPLPGQVSLVYRARAGLPRAAGTGVGLLITEFRAGLETAMLKKVAYIHALRSSQEPSNERGCSSYGSQVVGIHGRHST